MRGKQRRKRKAVGEEHGGIADLSIEDAVKRIQDLESRMHRFARNLEFEDAARLRDEIKEIKTQVFVDRGVLYNSDLATGA